MKAIICVGIPASGKTTFAENLCKKDRNWININRDDIRFSLTGTKGWSEYKFNESIEKIVTDVQIEIAEIAFNANKNIIVSDTNLNTKIRNSWKDYLDTLGYQVEIKKFPISFEEACKRDALRSEGVGRSVIYNMYQKWLKYTNRRVYTGPMSTLPDAYIVDVDGTLFDMEGVRGPYDWDKVHLDKPRDEIIDMVRSLSDAGNEIIIVSGRDGCCEAATRECLDNHGVPYDAFFIRNKGDTRKDTIIKEEIFWDRIYKNWNIVGVIDDRPCVCRMWRELGLNVIQVGDPDNEF